jgi:hypothetical protein
MQIIYGILQREREYFGEDVGDRGEGQSRYVVICYRNEVIVRMFQMLAILHSSIMPTKYVPVVKSKYLSLGVHQPKHRDSCAGTN